MKKNILNEELSRIKKMMGIHEQGLAGNPMTGQASGGQTYQTAPAKPQNLSPEQQIANKIVIATQGAGTNENGLIAAVKEIKSSGQFFNINAYLKTIGNKLDFAGIMNDEMDAQDEKYVNSVISLLKSIGVNASANTQGNFFHKNSFQIQGGASTQTTQQKTRTVFTPNEKIPLMFQQKGETIKQLQTKLGVTPVTGQFWTKTEAAVKKAAPEYNRQTGVTQDIWNKIMGTATAATQTLAPNQTGTPPAGDQTTGQPEDVMPEK